MSYRYDYAIRYDPDKDTGLDVFIKILYVLIMKRIKGHKPAVMFLCGDSGEGKSFGALYIQYLLLKSIGIDLLEYVNDINIYTPLQYPTKLDALLFDKRLKKIPFIAIHESRDLVKSSKWQGFIAQAIADVNAQSRSIKRLGVMIISQFIRDITKDMRYTLNYYMKFERPLNHSTRLRIYKIWKDDSDLEVPRLQKRKLTGYLVLPNGKWKKHCPDFFELSKPPKEITELFEKGDYESKATIIKQKLNKLMEEMEREIGGVDTKIDKMVDFYKKEPENVSNIGAYKRNKFKLNKDAINMHNLKPDEAREFERKMTAAIKEELKKREVIIERTPEEENIDYEEDL